MLYLVVDKPFLVIVHLLPEYQLSPSIFVLVAGLGCRFAPVTHLLLEGIRWQEVSRVGVDGIPVVPASVVMRTRIQSSKGF